MLLRAAGFLGEFAFGCAQDVALNGAATGSGACGFGVRSRTGLIQQHAKTLGRAPRTSKPGHLTQSPRLGGVGSEEEYWGQPGTVGCQV